MSGRESGHTFFMHRKHGLPCATSPRRDSKLREDYPLAIGKGRKPRVRSNDSFSMCIFADH